MRFEWRRFEELFKTDQRTSIFLRPTPFRPRGHPWLITRVHIRNISRRLARPRGEREREREREKKKKKKRREEREREKSDTSSPYWRNFVKVRARSFVLCSCTSAILTAVKIGWSGVRLTDPRCRCCKVDLIPPSPPRVGAVTLSKRRKIGRSRCIISFMSVTTALKAVRCHIREESYAVCWLFQIIATRSVRKGGETQWRCRSRE